MAWHPSSVRADSAPTTGDGRPLVIEGLTGVRAVMGLWIVADHLGAQMFTLIPALAFFRPVLSGGIALDTFFIMSGFVISHVYAQRLAARPGAWRAFLWARLARLYPTHLVALGVTALLVAFIAVRGGTLSPSLHVTVWTFLGNVAMLQAIPGVDAWNTPSWSVCTEFAAYLVIPVLAAGLVRVNRTGAVAGSLLVFIAVVLLTTLLGPAHPLVVSYWVRPLGDVALGALGWAGWHHGLGWDRVREHHGWDLVAVAAFAGVVIVAWAAPPSLLGLTVPLLAIVVVAVASSTGVVRRVLTWRPVEWLGRTSYSRYLMHLPVILAMAIVAPVVRYTHAAPALRAAIVVGWFVVVVGAGGLTYHLVEEPARRWMNRRGPARNTEHGDAAPASVTVTSA